MTPEEYVNQAKLTDNPDQFAIHSRLSAVRPELVHAMLGIASESGEIVDQFKKHFIYGKPLDIVNLMEEIGDLFWYCAILSEHTEISFETIMQKNIEKLRIRYPNKFTEYDALNRNLDAERKELEK